MSFLNEMEVFYYVATENSFSKAAKKLNLSKSYVSMQITNLEQTLGAKLLHRTTRRLNLTEAGSEFYLSCAKIIREKNIARSVVESMKQAPVGRLSITASPSMCTRCLAPVLPLFMEKYPEVSIELEATPRIVDLIQENIDIAIRITADPDERLIARKIGEFKFIVCASPKYLSTYGIPATPEELIDKNCLFYSADPGHLTWSLSLNGLEKKFNVTGNLFCNNDVVIYEALLAGKGIAMLPDYIVRKGIQQGQLTVLFEAYKTTSMPIYAVYPGLKYSSPKIAAFITFLKETLSTPY
ncbi:MULTISPECIES: LysR family transcriptional regulator [unclassified Legionella]|uniref:LysR family transcriptional regulator n=1 Tax=unclassified Legionella TaxID=2622702 RepID=UPI001055DBF0|nr:MULTISPECIES: LysR family transcriptional regulator [unclassified Legionella]MDI9818800.1 LysR family transcriptional regulator [Legionella sp. PL877]